MESDEGARLYRIARDVERVESLRAVKDLQRSYAHRSQIGRWSEQAELFDADAAVHWGDEVVDGRAAIESWLGTHDGLMDGRRRGSLHTELIDEPLVNLSADGATATGRWMVMRFLGDGRGGARIEGGLFDNDYVRRDDRWLISVLRYHPQFEGDDRDGWRNVDGLELPVIPTRFTPDGAGTPIPPPSGDAPATTATSADLSERIGRLNDEDAVRNLQHAYGYYVDRRMWRDVADLFDDDAKVSVAGGGVYTGRAGVLEAMERMGPEGLTHGQLNDHPIFDLVVDVLPGRRDAVTRGIQLGLVGDTATGEAYWEFAVLRSRLRRGEDGLWRLTRLSSVPLLRAWYSEGWRHGGIPLAVTPGARMTEEIPWPRLLAPRGAPSAQSAAAVQPSAAPGLADLERRLARSRAYDGVENISSAYGYYLDDFRWSEMSALFATRGHKQSPFAGYYVGRSRIMGAADANWGPSPQRRSAISFHWRTQPVIHVANDGRSAHLRTRLFQPRTSQDPGGSSRFYMGGLHSGMYPNDQAVLEDGVWRLWSLTIDEHYFTMTDWKRGWVGAVARPAGERPPRSRLLDVYPPDVLLTDLGRRQHGFRGGPGTPIEWPGILPMWFHYRNPVSGRRPELFWPDCVPAELLPEVRMTAHGYLMPPNGPEVDGVELEAPRTAEARTRSVS